MVIGLLVVVVVVVAAEPYSSAAVWAATVVVVVVVWRHQEPLEIAFVACRERRTTSLVSDRH